MASVTPLPQQQSALAALQNTFSIIVIGGEIRVVDNRDIAKIRAGSGHSDLAYYKRADANLIMRRYLETLPVSCEPKRIVADFLFDPKTRVYDTLAFSPRLTPPTTLNLWSPSPVQPTKGDWSHIRDFLYFIVCGGDRALFDYLIRFLAHMLQTPEVKPGVMLVLLGGQGIGKGTFFAILRALWPHTTLQVSDVDHVIGGFNAGLERSYAVLLDEAMFQGDRKALDRIKSLITESHVTIEAKYQPRRTIESFHRFFAASNHRHFAHVEPDDRRFLVMRLSEARKGDHDYFEALHAAIADPAVVAAMAYDLLHLDLTRFNIRHRPRTAEHMQQKLHSLEGFDLYWYEVLASAQLDPVSGHGEVWSNAHFAATAELISGYAATHQRTRHYRPITESGVRAALERLCPDAVPRRRKQLGRDQQRGYDLPSLVAAREAFEVALGGKIDWPDPIGADPAPPECGR